MPFTLDVTAFRQALSQAELAETQDDPDAMQAALEEALGLYRDYLLLGCYDEWIEPERERLRQQYMTALDRLVRLLEQQRAYLEAVHYAGCLLQKDPLRETTCRTMRRLYALRSDRASAPRVYYECAWVLERKLSVHPGRTTHELYERLLRFSGLSPRVPGVESGHIALNFFARELCHSTTTSAPLSAVR